MDPVSGVAASFGAAVTVQLLSRICAPCLPYFSLLMYPSCEGMTTCTQDTLKRWHAAGRMIAPVLEQLSRDYGDQATFYKVRSAYMLENSSADNQWTALFIYQICRELEMHIRCHNICRQQHMYMFQALAVLPLRLVLCSIHPDMRLGCTGQVDIDNDAIAATVRAAGVTGVPTFTFLRGTQRIAQFSGADRNALKNHGAGPAHHTLTRRSQFLGYYPMQMTSSGTSW